MFDLAIFDLDGTLVETAPEITDALNELFAELDVPRVEVAQVETWVGFGEKKTLESALASSEAGRARLAKGLDDDLLAHFDRCYFAHCGKRSRVYPHVAQVLCALGSAGVHRALVSNKEPRTAMKVLDAHGLADDLEFIVCAAGKPDPRSVRQCLDYFGVDREQAVLIGDSSIDVATARAAGIASWCVPYGYNGGKPIADAKPDRLLKNFREVGTLITGSALPDPERSAVVF
ncbi:MAG TPA: HAD-IA family hydrolase [Nevskiaceae bacterium]|nr:HAD-IA family hydrolase [Nevskiaceae bacterium]